MPAKAWAGQLSLAVLLLGTLCLAACKSDVSNVSPGVQDDGQLEGAILIDTFRMVGTTYQYDSTYASEGAGLIVGNYQDAAGQTGSVYSEGYFDYALPSNTDQFPDSTVFDTLLVSLPYTWRTTPALGTSISVELHALTAPLPKDKAFFIQEKQAYDPKVLATATVVCGLDSLNHATTGNLTFSLTDPDPGSVGQQLMAWGKQAAFGVTYSDNIAFSQHFPGFALVPVGSGTPVLNVISSSGSFTLIGSFRGGSYTRVARAFTLAGTYSRWHNYIEATRPTGSPLAGIDRLNPLPASQANGRIYVQNLTSLWTKLDLPTYAASRRSHPELTLLRAILELPADPIQGTYTGPLSKLLLWQGTADRLSIGRNGNYLKAIPNGSSGSSVASDQYVVTYDATSNRYLADVTDYMLAIEKGTALDAGIWITAPVSVPILAPFSFSLYPGSGNRADYARLRTYFVALER